MAARFRFVVEATDVVLDPVPRATAVRQLTRGVPDPEGQPWFRPLARGADIDCAGAVSLADLDADATFWPGWDVGVLSIGWGADGRAEAIMVLGHRADGRPVWRGLFYSAAGFELPR